VVKKSSLNAKYARETDSESAYEILTAKLQQAQERTAEQRSKASPGRPAKKESFFDNPVIRQAGRTAASVLTRSLLGALGLGGRRR